MKKKCKLYLVEEKSLEFDSGSMTIPAKNVTDQSQNIPISDVIARFVAQSQMFPQIDPKDYDSDTDQPPRRYMDFLDMSDHLNEIKRKYHEDMRKIEYLKAVKAQQISAQKFKIDQQKQNIARMQDIAQKQKTSQKTGIPEL